MVDLHNPSERRLHLHPRHKRVIHFLHRPRALDVLQVRPHGQPVGDVEAVVQLGVVFGTLQRHETGVVVVVDAARRVEQFRPLLHIVVDVDSRYAKADIVLGPTIKETFVDHAHLLVVVHHVGGLVVHRGIGEQAQPATGIAAVRL